jgi:adenylate kinase
VLATQNPPGYDGTGTAGCQETILAKPFNAGFDSPVTLRGGPDPSPEWNRASVATAQIELVLAAVQEANVSRKDLYSAILMFGGPGSGKGTQGEVLGKMPNLVHLAMGDIFRALDKESDLGKEFLSFSTQGLLVPDELTVRVFQKHVEDRIAAGEIKPDYHTLILDGIPRTVAQVELLNDIIDPKRVVHLVMDDKDALIARLMARASKSGRPDDADESIIRKRIEVYERETAPVLEAYPKKIVARVNGDQPPLAVLRDVADCLIDYVSPKL